MPPLWPLPQFGFQIQNDVVKQARRKRISSFTFHEPVALDLRSAFFPVVVLKHGPALPIR
jgi:hypothetical protein